ncbi:MAG: hypothetical protein ACRDA5_01460 [Clostridium sp.]
MTKKDELLLEQEALNKKALNKKALEDIKAKMRAEIEAEVRAEMEDKKDGVPVTNNESDLAKFERNTKQILDAEEKVMIFIPEDIVNNNPVATVSINGVTYAIPRGVELLVPKSIKAIWDESYSKTMAINRRIKIEQVKNSEVSIID